MTKVNDLFGMKLHETIKPQELPGITITCVYGGWIYDSGAWSVFVPRPPEYRNPALEKQE